MRASEATMRAISAAVAASVSDAPAPASRRPPVVSAPATTAAENVAWARFMIGRPVSASLRTPSALIATSAAPDVAPSNGRTRHNASSESARPGRTAAPGEQRDRHRQRQRPLRSMTSSCLGLVPYLEADRPRDPRLTCPAHHRYRSEPRAGGGRARTSARIVIASSYSHRHGESDEGDDLVTR